MAKPGLILIDIQDGFDDPVWGARNNPGAEAQAARLLAHWRARGWPLHHVQHLSVEPQSPLNPANGGAAIKAIVAPRDGEPVHQKRVNSALIGTTLLDDLREAGVVDLVVCGLTTPHCVSTTSRMAANLGFGVTLAHDACAAVTRNGDPGWRGGEPLDPQAIHEAALDHLNGEFAKVRSTDDILNDPW